ncbi:hypothetical protein [Arthrobacter sp. SLBN-53]|uniref:hypothetical protein n=1 Tax=Arthrobacter sp. SLBN-53 TaxID=2768412 RepID=UPI0011534297|nr:hypothetical protein [Arthrobacter sp. SLBN-53]TQK27687.1 hypothetical protein FBY28_0646 [Arthrobacter sp. SLBN-53]
MRRSLAALSTAAVIAAAAWTWHGLPIPDEVFAPFDVEVAMGQQATGAAVTAQVDGVRIGPRVDKTVYPPGTVDAVGVWVAVDGTAMTTRRDQVPSVELIVGPNTYAPTSRLGVVAVSGSLAPGIRASGSWVFDVPPDLVAPGRDRVTLRMWVGDWRLNSRLVIDIDLADPRVQRTDRIDIGPGKQVGT